jgi:hypothetical protein
MDYGFKIVFLTTFIIKLNSICKSVLALMST